MLWGDFVWFALRLIQFCLSAVKGSLEQDSLDLIHISKPTPF